MMKPRGYIAITAAARSDMHLLFKQARVQTYFLEMINELVLSLKPAGRQDKSNVPVAV